MDVDAYKMSKKRLRPDFVIESSWEVCNKVGGIYTVLSTRAKTLQEALPDRVVFIGPDVWSRTENPLFKENKTLLASWRNQARSEGLNVRVGRWLVPGQPIAVLVDFTPFYEQKNTIYTWAWEHYSVDSLHAYGDYDEASMFSIAAGKVVESLFRYHQFTPQQNVIYQAHEWMTALGALYVQQACPSIATIFTTHATSIGRSIAGNNKPLYDCLSAYNGDQMASELNMQSKHSIEKQAAHHVDCFTTVSDLTATECKQLLEKEPDVVLINGFENDFVPRAGRPFDAARKRARRKLLDVANTLMGTSLGDDTLIISTGGRYEYKNKGIDMFIDALNRLRHDPRIQRPVVAFALVPAWVGEPRADLGRALDTMPGSARVHKTTAGRASNVPLGDPRITHTLHNYDTDRMIGQMNWLGIHNNPEDRVKIIFVPCYLDGRDGIFNMHYYDLLVGMDLCIYPSYYEPWGYTPTESIAFHVPTITTNLAGFGLWVLAEGVDPGSLADGVQVVKRTDNNFEAASKEISRAIIALTGYDATAIEQARKCAATLAEKALWKHFISRYWQAYDIALRKAKARNK